jgi:hypothetical protein
MELKHRCPECAQPLTRYDARRSDQVCPHCGAELPGALENQWINVARVANLAEAGFLADELAGEGVDARIFQTEDLSAVSDRWTASFLIQARPLEAQAAAARIRRYLAELEANPEPEEELKWDNRPAELAMWRPLALVVLAGMASFVIGQQFSAEREAPRPQRNNLSRAVPAIGRPLVSEPAAALPRHRFYYHRGEQAWFLETDADADGRYEGRQRLQSR